MSLWKKGILFTLLFVGTASASFVGVKKSTEFISFQLNCLDSSGVDGVPDSAHIFTFLDAGTSTAYSNRTTTAPFDGIGIDTTKNYGDTVWWFSDQIQDIDGTPTPPTYQLSIDVVMWTGGIATHNYRTVQVIADSLNQIWAIRDTANATLDTLQLWDTRVDSIEAALADVNIGDKVWADGSQANRDRITDIEDTANAILDTLQLWDTRVDSIEAALADVNIGDKVWADGSQANRDRITDIEDTVNAVLDTLQLWDTRVDSIEAGVSDVSIGEKVWEYDTANVGGDPGMGAMLKDTAQYQGAGGTPLDSATTHRVVQRAVYGMDTLGVVGSISDDTLADSQGYMGYWLSPVSYVSISQVRDTVWATDTARFDDSTHQMGGALLQNIGSVSLSAATQAQIDSIENASRTAAVRAKVWWADTATYTDSTLTVGFMQRLNDTALYVSLGNIPDTLSKDVSYQDSIKSIVDDTLRLAHGDSSWTGTETSGGGAATDTSAIKTMVRLNSELFRPDVRSYIVNGAFERDSVGGTTAPYGWTYAGKAQASALSATSPGGLSNASGQWYMALNSDGTYLMYQKVGFLKEGLYALRANVGPNTADCWLFRDGHTPDTTTGHSDSLNIASGAGDAYRTLIFAIAAADTASAQYVGIGGDPNSAPDIDDVTLTFLTGDTSVYQGAAGSLTAAEVMDSLFARLVSDTATGTYLATLLSTAGSGSDTSAILTMLINNMDSLTNDSVWAALDTLQAWSLLIHSIDSIRDSVQYLVTGGSGTGANTVQIGATDTSGTDTLVSGIRLTVRDIAGNLIGSPQVTNSGGFAAFNLDADTFTVQVHSIVQNDHIWPAGLDTFVVATNPDSFYVGNGDTVAAGYDFGVGVPATANLSRVFINGLADAEGNYLSGAQITAILRGINLIDTSTNQPISAHRAVSALTDTLGYTFIDLQKTVLLNQNVGYTITVTKGRDIILQIDGFSVPDQDSVRISP